MAVVYIKKPYRGAGKRFFVDDADLPFVTQHEWGFDKFGYVVCKGSDPLNGQYLTRLLMGLPPRSKDRRVVRFLNKNRLDYRRENLAIELPEPSWEKEVAVVEEREAARVADEVDRAWSEERTRVNGPATRLQEIAEHAQGLGVPLEVMDQMVRRARDKVASGAHWRQAFDELGAEIVWYVRRQTWS